MAVETLPAPRAILFDWDNTLVDNWIAIHRALNLTLEAMGHPTWTVEETRLRVQHSLRDSFPQMFGDRWPAARDIFYQSFADVHLSSLKPMLGATEMLGELSGCGLYMAVVSNKTGRFLRIEAEHLGWRGHFAQMIGATDAPRDKPAVEPVDLALAESGIARSTEVWMVGDAAVDVECARNAGLSAVLVGHHPTGEVAAEGPVGGQVVPRLPDCFALADLVRRYFRPHIKG